MGGAPGSNQQLGNLAQRANPNMSDPMQNMNPNGFPRGRNTMGGAQGGAGGPGAPGPMGQPMPGGGAQQPFQRAQNMIGQLTTTRPTGNAFPPQAPLQQVPGQMRQKQPMPPGAPSQELAGAYGRGTQPGQDAGGASTIGMTPPGSAVGSTIAGQRPGQPQQIGQISNLPGNMRQIMQPGPGAPSQIPGMRSVPGAGMWPSAPTQPPGMGGPGQPRMITPPGGRMPTPPGLGGMPRSGAPGPPMPNRLPPTGGMAGGAGPVTSQGGGK